MKDRLKTLVLTANGYNWKMVLTDTALRGVLRVPECFTLPPGLQHIGVLDTLFGQRYARQGYIADWQEAICASPQLDVRTCNINNLVDYAACMRQVDQYDLIIITHVAAGDSMAILLKTMGWFQRRQGKIAMFIGNEYDLMNEKIGFMRAVEVEYICSQLPIATARWLYAECHRAQVLAMPHALNPQTYYSDPQVQRTVDIGFIGHLYERIIGDRERTDLIEYFQQKGADHGLHCDIRFSPLERTGWQRFLSSCKAIIGAESGTYYLDRRGAMVAAAKAYVATNPSASFFEVVSNCFHAQPNISISGKAISSRHFEPIGTKTAQILIEGHYNGILHADEHYISVKRDLSNIADAINRFNDDAYRNAMVERTYEYVMDCHTYTHRIATLVETISGRDDQTKRWNNDDN